MRDSKCQGPFVIAAVDPDAPTPQNPTNAQIRHFLGGNFAPNRLGLLSNSTPAISEFRQPTPPAGSDAHRYDILNYIISFPSLVDFATIRYIFLLFEQPRGFNSQKVVNAMTPIQNFDIAAFASAVGLGDPIAGSFMLVAPDT